MSQLRKIIQEEINTINYSDLPDGKWSNKKSNVKQNTIPEVITKLQEIYTRYGAAIKKLAKTYENVIVKEVGLDQKEASFLLSEMEDKINDDQPNFDGIVSVMGADLTIFDYFNSLNEKFGDFDLFKKEIEKMVHQWQDKFGDAEDENGFICDQIEYDEDSEELRQMFFQGLSPEQAFHKLIEQCGLEKYLN
jgi:hypothetical protein